MPARFANTCWNMHETDTRRGIVAGKLERGFIRKERHCRRGNISVTEMRTPRPVWRKCADTSSQPPAIQRLAAYPAITGDGDRIFRHACAMGLEGIVSKRIGSRYVSGRTRAWLKTKNPGFERR